LARKRTLKSQFAEMAAAARAIRRQLAFGLRRTIPLALPRDLAIEVARFVAEAITRSMAPLLSCDCEKSAIISAG
jgi:hypothetical protein